MASLSEQQRAVITKTRKILSSASTSMSDLQKLSLAQANFEDLSWISKVTFPAPTDVANNLWDLTQRAITALGDQDETIAPARCPIQSVDARWIGHRRGDDSTSQSSHSLSEIERYEFIVSQTDKSLTVMYFHGGGFLSVLLEPL